MTIPQMIEYINNTHVSVADHEMLREYILKHRNMHPFNPSTNSEDEVETEYCIDKIELYCEKAERVQELISNEEESAHNNPSHPAHAQVVKHFLSDDNATTQSRVQLNRLLLSIISNQL